MSRRAGNPRLAVAVVMAITVLLACTGASTTVTGGSGGLVPAAFEACYNGKCLSYATWGKHVDKAINGQAVGYAYRVAIRGTITNGYNNYGHARTAADPPVTAMSVKQPFDVASVSKTLTAVAVLNLLSAEHVSVGSAIGPYLPPSWQLGPGVSAITFAELLTQTSGIRYKGTLVPTVPPNAAQDSYDALKALMGQTILPGYKAMCQQDYQQRLQGKQSVLCYNNNNFALLRIIIAYLWHNGNPEYPTLLSLLSLAPDQYDHALDELTAQDYLAYLNSVFGPSIPISCTPQGSGEMLAYIYPGTQHGSDLGDWKTRCGAAGIELSADQMATFLANLGSGAYLPQERVLSTSPYTTTVSEMVSNLYGWDYQYQNTTYGTCVQKNGAFGNKYIPATATDAAIAAAPAVRTLIVYCVKTGLGFAGLANSLLGQSQIGWESDVETAYNASWH
jgi:CubicO group peptidase (beta-lactamase class C family)